MKIITDNNFKIEYKTAVAIGKFDGIHKGHEKLLKELIKYKSDGFKCAVFTFQIPIASFFSGEKVKVLMSLKEKEEYLSEIGIDYLIEFPVNEETVSIEPIRFIREILVKKMQAGVIIAGPDCSFGHYGKGDFALLNQEADQNGYRAVMISKEREEDQTRLEISSSYVRSEIEKGNMEHAKRLLGRPYCVSGRVMKGRQLGRQLSMPTVNLIPGEDKLLPPFGVYFSDVYVGTMHYCGITNIGKKPTISDHEAVTVETFLYDFDDDLYGEFIQVDLQKFARPEQKFPSISALEEKLKEDMINGKEFHQNNPCHTS